MSSTNCSIMHDAKQNVNGWQGLHFQPYMRTKFGKRPKLDKYDENEEDDLKLPEGLEEVILKEE